GPTSARLKERVARGLDWLVGVQDNTGAWGIGNYDSWIDESATAGMALLAEGSTPSRGRYAPALQKLLDYYVPPPRADGGGGPSRADLLLIRKNSSTLFLSQVYAVDENVRARLRPALEKAVRRIETAQLPCGGWGEPFPPPPPEGEDSASLTVIQLQALHAARQAGFDVSPEVLAKAHRYLEQITVPVRGAAPSPALARVGWSRSGVGCDYPRRATETAAAVAICLQARRLDSPYLPSWLRFVEQTILLTPEDEWGDP